MSYSVAPIDFSALLEMLGGKRELVASLLDTFVAELATGINIGRQFCNKCI